MAAQGGSGQSVQGLMALIASLEEPLDTRFIRSGVKNLADYLERRGGRRADERRS